MVIFFGIEERPITLTKGKGTWGVVREITHVFVSCSYGLWHRDVRSLGPTVSPIDNAPRLPYGALGNRLNECG